MDSLVPDISHDDVEYAVNDENGEERVFHTFDVAASLALCVAVTRGEAVLDVLIWSEEGAKAYG
ncbi:MAG: hypothetical protein WB770_08640, partial [Acidimicrobiales bacterium]